jgi:DNA-binding transcriptional regulator YiaG
MERQRVGGIPSKPAKRIPPYALAVRSLRFETGMVSATFAESVGCTLSAISRWENGKTRPSRLAEQALKAVGYEYGLTVDFDAGIVTRRAA